MNWDEKTPVLPCWYCEGRCEDGPFDPKSMKGWGCEACDERREFRAKIERLREHIEKALLDFCQGSCPTCGDDYPEDPLADGCDTCIWVHDAQALLDSTEPAHG